MNTKKPLSILLTVALLVGLISWTVLPVRATESYSIPYVDQNGTSETCDCATVVDSNMDNDQNNNYLGSTEKRVQVSGIQNNAKAIAPAGGRRSWL